MASQDVWEILRSGTEEERRKAVDELETIVDGLGKLAEKVEVGLADLVVRVERLEAESAEA